MNIPTSPLAVLDIVPGWAWAALLAAYMVHGCAVGHQRDVARLDAQAQKTRVSDLNTAIERNKGEAAQKLAAESERVRNAERALQAQKDAQEIRDAQAKTVSDDLRQKLRTAAGPAGRLRDPNAPTCTGGGSGGAGAEGAAPGHPADRPADGAETGGLLSTDLTGLLQRLTREADAINDAYASCKPTVINDKTAN
ncbi:hypothetical protein RD110_15625 [Rhodoferax koreense]|uniref:Uncharacterized protein n=1 Tax=Rhodoferax koreensis TaxID=1842727 RepID=A0A1P8JXG4_9BURK|nr:hypothetical protein [Rhodoferax koreense]APW38452.1 hypothetical protein RD110_15625 [Rhodoferax koreense]